MTATPAELWAEQTVAAIRRLSAEQREAIRSAYFGDDGRPPRNPREGDDRATGHLARGLQALAAQLMEPAVDVGA